MSLSDALKLIVITDASAAKPRSVYEVVEAALGAGARSIQVRNKGATARELLEEAKQLRKLTRSWDALLFVNDRFDVALAAGADGVHLGPEDLPPESVGRVCPPDFLIGASTDEPEVAIRLAAQGVSYIGCGAVFPTTTKKDAGEVIGVERLREVAEAVEIPVVGIGGVTPDGARKIAAAGGACGVAVVSAVMGAPDPGKVVRELLEPFE
jgi:thiamine-phosphate pyrophosphorylase